MSDSGNERKRLSVVDAVAVCIGIVVGAGIFRTPSLVAGNAGSTETALMLWVAGGVIALIGALCYAELASAYPNEGGDYSYLYRAYGPSSAFLFSWARLTVIQTGSIALLAFIIGDYATQVLPLGGYSSALYAGMTIIALTGLNIAGLRPGMAAQKFLTAAIGTGLLAMAAVGFFLSPPAAAVAKGSTSFPGWGALGHAMIFVVFTYGGWNEAVYLSAEMRDRKRDMVLTLFVSIALICGLYVLVNAAYLKALGPGGVAGSQAVAADLMRGAFGAWGGKCISLFIVIAALSTMNGAVITGARSSFALGRDFRVFRFMGTWSGRGSTPVNALLLQGAAALALVVLGAGTRSGFETLVDYTAPVFWLFFLLTGTTLFVLRRKDPHRERPFRTPLYPLTPILFCLVSAYLLRASLLYTGKGALAGVAVLAAGVPILVLDRFLASRSPTTPIPATDKDEE